MAVDSGIFGAEVPATRVASSVYVKAKAIPVTVLGGLQGISRLPHSLDIGSENRVNMSHLGADSTLPTGRFLVLIYVKSMSRTQHHRAARRVIRSYI